MNSGASDVLVIGYGNPLRGDDGLGPYVAELVAARNWPGVRTRAVQQLTPELATELARVRFVVFVDASAVDRENAITTTEVSPAEPAAALMHAADPRALLALTQALYGVCPAARLLTIAGRQFEVGDRISPTAAANAMRAVERIAELLPACAQTRRPGDDDTSFQS